ncbi:hypothetical protein [Sphingobacterium humi]|uniref:Uncharacterized protein n=1 Tax=Sphingobacterium humi TaxID=1796905 RepID=A0A6N8L0I6_9SPHI|nr:hypothetical protein [Sphingobacterium humi]MVZ63250.1 hypothetical protein [Sphingobacterium humi]
MMKKMLKIVIYSEKKTEDKTEIILTTEHPSVKNYIKVLELLFIPDLPGQEKLHHKKHQLTSNKRKN